MAYDAETDGNMVTTPVEVGDTVYLEVEVDRGQREGRSIRRVFLDPLPRIHASVKEAIGTFDACVIGPGSFYTSLMPTLLVDGVADAVRATPGPIVVVTNILTEGRGMRGFSVGAAVRRVGEALGRPVDVAVANTANPGPEVLDRYAPEHKELLPIGDIPDGCELVTGDFWQGSIARHARRRLAYAVWGVLAERLL